MKKLAHDFLFDSIMNAYKVYRDDPEYFNIAPQAVRKDFPLLARFLESNEITPDDLFRSPYLSHIFMCKQIQGDGNICYIVSKDLTTDLHNTDIEITGPL